tara:strand:+ start:2366 stop:3952 length:1587 start_codon:yes stop_codon:yes gene_type:complete
MATPADFTVNQDPRALTDSYDAMGVHEEYRTHYPRWKFLANSYMGGYEWKMGEYLTKYVYESGDEYGKRIASTPYDNHVKSITSTYNAFLYRNSPMRDYGSIRNRPELQDFLEDADLEGRTWDSFMRDVNTWSTVFGHVLVLMDKPKSVAGTRAEELEQGIRPYANLFVPENILDWQFQRTEGGKYELVYLKLLEVEQKAYGQVSDYYIREFTRDTVTLSMMSKTDITKQNIVEQMPNELGKIPAVFVYANRGPTRGVGISDIGDIADMAMAISNEWSECEQLIRLTNHPSLVVTPEVDAAAGAGAIIKIPNETDAGLKPYLLQPGGQSVDGILKSIDDKIKAIDRMAHLGAIRSIETRQMSGVAMQSEFLLLDAKLCEKAKNLQLAEEQIWRLFALWLGEPFDGTIRYPMAFHIRDKNMDMDILKKVAETSATMAKSNDLDTAKILNKKIKELLAHDEEELYEFMHPVTSPASRSKHIQEMIMEGYTDQQMLQIHPEISQADITQAKQELLNSNNEQTETQTPPEEL